jgi:hypothetical protein
MSSQSTDKQDHHGSADVGGKRPYPTLELKKLSPTAALQWLESKSSSSDRATSEQIEELKENVRAWIPDGDGAAKNGIEEIAQHCTLAHELNNDLGVIIGECDLLVDILAGEAAALARLKIVRTTACQMANMISTRPCPVKVEPPSSDQL